MENEKSTNVVMGGALLAAGVALVAFGAKREAAAPAAEAPRAAPSGAQSAVTVNVNTAPAEPKKEPLPPPKPPEAAPKPKEKPRVRYHSPIGVSDKTAIRVPVMPPIQPPVMPMVQPSVMPVGIRNLKDNLRHYLRPENERFTFNTMNGMYELEGLGASGLDGRWRARTRARRAAQSGRGQGFANLAARLKSRQQAANKPNSAFARYAAIAKRQAALKRNASLAGEAKMRRALEILRRNGMF